MTKFIKPPSLPRQNIERGKHHQVTHEIRPLLLLLPNSPGKLHPFLPFSSYGTPLCQYRSSLSAYAPTEDFFCIAQLPPIPQEEVEDIRLRYDREGKASVRVRVYLSLLLPRRVEKGGGNGKKRGKGGIALREERGGKGEELRFFSPFLFLLG